MNSNIFQKNCDLFSTKNSEIARAIENASADGSIALNENKEIIIHHHDQYLLQPQAPQAEAIARCNGIPNKERYLEVIIVEGFTSLYFAAYLIKKIHTPIIFYEPDLALLKQIAMSIDLSEIVSASNVYFACDEEQLVSLIQLHHHHETVPEVYALPYYQKVFPESITIISKAVQRASSLIAARLHTLKDKSRTVTINTLLNAVEFVKYPDISQLKDKGKNFPVLVIGAGPSLDYTISSIKDNYQGYIIICVDVAVRALLKQNILPHFICTAETNNFSWKNIPSCESVLVVTEDANQNVYSIPMKKMIALQNNHNAAAEIAKFFSIDTITSNSTVSSVAFQLAMILAGNPVILCGHDLSFVPGKYYSEKALAPDDSVIEKIRSLQRRNPLNLVSHERLLLDPIHGSFLTEEDRLNRMNISNEEYNKYYSSEELIYMTRVIKKHQASQKKGNIKILGIDGNMLDTEAAYLALAKWIELEAGLHLSKNPTKQFYNISLGAVLKNFETAKPALLSEFKENVYLTMKSLIESWSFGEMARMTDLKNLYQREMKQNELLLQLLYQGKKSGKLLLKHKKNKVLFPKYYNELVSFHLRFNEIINKDGIFNYYYYKERSDLEQILKDNTSDIEPGFTKFFETIIPEAEKLTSLLKSLIEKLVKG